LTAGKAEPSGAPTAYGETVDLSRLKPRSRRARLFALIFDAPAARYAARQSRRFAPTRAALNLGVRLILNRPPVYIYSPRKTATETVLTSLRLWYPGKVVKEHQIEGAPRKRAKLHPALNLEFGDELWRNAPLRVIALVRNPIENNIANFFQRLYRGFVKGVAYDPRMSMDELRAAFLNNYEMRDHALNWFEENIERCLGIDVYAEPFPRRGYAVYERGDARLLTLKTELADADKARAVAAFLRLKRFELVNANISARKVYGDLYRRFCAEVKLPGDYVDRLCDSRYFTHFYGAEEIETARQKWRE